MHSESITRETTIVLEKISKNGIIADFYLAGGTALALQLGHRKSIDLDWFTKSSFIALDLQKKLAALGKFELTSETPGTIHGLLDNVRVSFFLYDYPQLFPLFLFKGVNIADERDIAAMKLAAVSSRGSKKDFIDLYFLAEKYSLEELINFFEHKFNEIKYNRLHLLKSLVYFDDAENEPTPMMLKSINWEAVKKKIRQSANELLKE